MRNKLFSLFTVLSLLVVMFAVPVQASEVDYGTANHAYSISSNYFSGSTGTMNSFQGNQSRIFNISSGSVSDNAEVSDIELRVTVSSGSSPFYIVVKEPNGDFEQYKVTSSTTLDITDFENYKAKGTWQVYITGSSLVSTATARMIVNYTY